MTNTITQIRISDSKTVNAQITVENGHVSPGRTFGTFGILSTKDIYKYKDIHNYRDEKFYNSFKYFTEALSPKNVKFFVEAKGTQEYKQKLLEAIDCFAKEGYVKAFAYYANELDNYIKQKINLEYDIKANEIDNYIKQKINLGYDIKALRDDIYNNIRVYYYAKTDYYEWEYWLKFYDYKSGFDKDKSEWFIRSHMLATALKEKYSTESGGYSTKELAAILNELLYNPQRWNMFDDPEQTRAKFQAYINTFDLEKLREYSQQLARELYF